MPASRDKRCSGYLAPFWNALLKLNAHRIKFLKPRFSSKILEVLDERVPRRQKRGLVTLLGTVALSMLKEIIEIEVFYTAKVFRAETQIVKITRIE